ncbi:MAG: hypothetical protein MUF13_05260, partial [Akkermansiaceae bacterium]|nr:hypothetical protein [Akkermansiaceae bacterium]
MYAAKPVLSNSRVNSLLDLQRINEEADCKYQGLHSDTVVGIQTSLVAVLDNLLNVEIQCCSVFGILCDEST